MSKKETDNTEQKQEKIVTSYDRKMQKRKEQKEKEKKEQRMTAIVGTVIVIALVCLVASFPIRTYLATHETFAKIGGEAVTKVEFDYNYNTVKNNYLAQYGSYMSYFGVDMTGDLSAQMYSETLTWQDFFEQTAVDNLIRQKALYRQAETEGFAFDTEEEYAEFEKSVKDAAAQAGVSTREYVKQLYGPYATLGRISGYVKDSIYVNEYFAKLAEDKAPGEEEIQAYYEENRASYDSVDYRLVTVDAQLPTEPTELADAAETEAEDTKAEGTQAEESTAEGNQTEEAYQPSEAEIAAAMAEAKEKADAAVETVAQGGELQENVLKADTTSLLRDWLFDSGRKAGDTTVIEDSINHRYYVLAFEKRYLDETPTVDARVLITQEDGQTLLDEWSQGEATEDSFGALCSEHSTDLASASQGGLYEGIVKSGMPEILSSWLFDGGRKAGDTVSISSEEDGNTYVMYYIGTNDPQWELSAANTLLGETLDAYVEEISAGIEVEDPKGNLHYLQAEAEAETADQTQEASEETAETGETAASAQ